MSETVIEVDGISKLYRLGEVGTGSLAHDVNRWWHRMRRREDPYSQVGQANDRTKKAVSDWVWALKDINFEVKQGEVIGFIGRNGAGKSTLLKILSRVTAPTTGEVRVKGRIASLLEVGTGFHPELSGRENIFLNGAILGMTRTEIRAKLDEIVDFSGCEAYLDTPVKRYSSGMQVRLAFAVAAHLDPEILIVDEVLAVGDAEFQKKCIGRMSTVAKEGRTVLFVSHNMTAVRSLCDRVILLRNGQTIADAETEEVLHVYQHQDFKATLRRQWASPEAGKPLFGSGMYIKEAKIILEADSESAIRVNSTFSIAFCVHSKCRARVNLSPHYQGTGGEVIFAAPSPVQEVHAGDNWFICKMPGNLLNDGIYLVQLVLVEDSAAVQILNEALVFEVHDLPRDSAWHGKWPGVVRPNLDWSFQHSSPGTQEAEVSPP